MSIATISALVLSLLVVAGPLGVHAQAPPADRARSGPLFAELARMDSLLFDASFVTCRADVANSMFTEDIEFYHDQTGLGVGEEVRANTQRLTESCPRQQGVSRILVPGSLEVYPISGYGAVQMGEHRFQEEGAPQRTVARFVHVWRKTDEGWRLSRVLSFDHVEESAPRRTP